jgi:hypothetical protein
MSVSPERGECQDRREGDGDKLAGERIYYDRATVFRQVGIFHDPQTALGRALTALTHPVTIGRALARKVKAGFTR